MASWAAGLRADIARLDFKREFEAAGRAYAELDEDGRAVLRTPPFPRPHDAEGEEQ